MNFDLNDDQREIRDTARSLLEKRCSPAVVANSADLNEYDEDLWAEMTQLGWTGIAIPEDVGGLGLGMVELCVLLEEQGAALAPTPLLPSVSAALMINRAGTEDQREQWLPQLAEGRAVGAIGSTRDEGAPTWVAGGSDSDVLVTIGGIAAFLDPAETHGLTPAETIDQLRRYSTTESHGAPLKGNVERGRFEVMVAVSAELLGVARRAMEMTIEFVKERSQFGVPIGSFQAVAHRCSAMLLAVEGARSALYSAAWVADSDPSRLKEAALLAKLLSTQAGVEVTSSAIQAHGGIGFTWEADIHWWYKRAQLDAHLLGAAKQSRRDLGDAFIESVREEYADSKNRLNSRYTFY